jgi:5-methylcytosine-specific restriction endonuclease McrA
MTLSMRERRLRLWADLFGNAKLGVCHWCKRKLHHTKATLEHITPQCDGGTNDMDNLAIACRTCNKRRGVEQARKNDPTYKGRS